MRLLPPPCALTKASRGAYQAPKAEYISVLKPMALLNNASFNADTTIDEYLEDTTETPW